MPHPTLAAYGLAGVLALALPLTGPFERRLYRSDPATPRKLAVYGALVALLTGLTVAAVAIDGWGPLLTSPAAGGAWPAPSGFVGPVLGVAAAAYFALALAPFAQSLRGPRWRGAYAAAIRRAFADIPGLLPNTPAERAGFALLSLAAGIGEETLFRGFLIRLLHDSAFAMPLTGALLASSLIFGLGHLYQGFNGVLRTALAGVVFGLVFLLTGSLIPCMVLHALMDVQMVYVLRPLPAQAATTAA